MGIGLVGSFGAAGAGAGLEDILKRRMEARMLADAQTQRDIENRQRERQISLQERVLTEPKPQPERGPYVVGNALVDPRGGVLYSGPEKPQVPVRPMTAAPGSSIIDPASGRIIVTVPDRPAKPEKSPDQDAGWALQQVSDPKTNTTSLVRVNKRTGQVQPVLLPDGTQPGGQRQARLTASQQEDLATMKTVEDMAGEVLKIGEDTKWNGVGGLGQGSIQQFGARNFGMGTPQAETLRNFIGNVQATIAKLRGGTSFTANEQKLLETYTPTINDSPLSIKSKLNALNTFIKSKRQNTLQYAGADMGAAQKPAPAAGGSFKVIGVR